MKFILFFIFATILLSDQNDLYNMSLKSLGEIEIYTANKELTSYSESSAVITVITAEQIKEQGLKNLNEVLQRVPGMFTYNDWIQPFVIHRGIKQDQNTAFLLLIDGVSQNSKVAYGFDMEHTFPNLFNVKQIEIIRGSSSTLWGSDAATAVVNIITYKASDLDTRENKHGIIKAAYNHHIQSKADTLDLLYAKQFDNFKLMTSYTYTQSDADINHFPIGNSVRHSAWNTERPSHNLYMNASYFDFTLTARYAKQSRPETTHIPSTTVIVNPDDTKGNRERTIGTINLKHKLSLSDNFRVETQIGHGFNNLNIYRTRTNKEDPNYLESNEYLETILYSESQNWKNLIGVKYIQNHLELANLQLEGSLLGEAIENIYAGFFQTTYTGIDDLKIVLGLRVSESDLRSTALEVMPKFSMLYHINDNWNAKYSYSTGLIHALRVYNESTYWVLYKDNGERSYHNGTNLPQEVETHEIQITYKNKDFTISPTFFYVDIKNQFNNVGQTEIDTKIGADGITEHYILWYANHKLIHSEEFELEFTYMPDSTYNIYGNLTFQNSYHRSPTMTSSHNVDIDKYETGKQTQGVPTQLYNLGVNVEIFNDSSLNVHYRANNGFRLNDKDYGLQSYLDMNYRSKNVFMKNLDMSLYGKNIFDNTELEDRDSSTASNLGLNVGFSLEYTF